ncbi:MAG: monofunctional biosynthetic peptidoglycan transglycosylase [Gammaproteobacteria bacterium]|nr:monofunctional biosynthetic peptidoglycan transglycosylase [Gammaproteobacteria bacterium]MCP5135673.1 monofunctional biosynthetic peptidoglycan transglycosylase [Gammaproteobacteria bacterium]
MVARRRLSWAFVWLIGISLLPVLLFRFVDPGGSAVMWQRHFSEGRVQNMIWVRYERISPSMRLAVVASEDQLFPQHWGFDGGAIRQAILDRFEGKSLRGASTITQQVARNLFLWQGRSFVRKGLEAWYTMWLEILWPKQRILEVYLNIAETGPATFGVAAAARRYFDVPAHALSESQAALIAAVLPNPVVYRVEAPSERVLARRDWILRQMHNLGGSRYLEDL